MFKDIYIETFFIAEPGEVHIEEIAEMEGSDKYLHNVRLRWNVKQNPSCITSYSFSQEEFDNPIYHVDLTQKEILLHDLKLCVNYTFSITATSIQNYSGKPLLLPHKKIDKNDPPVLIKGPQLPCTNCSTTWQIIGNNCPLAELVVSCQVDKSPEVNPSCVWNNISTISLTGNSFGVFEAVVANLAPWTNYKCEAYVDNSAKRSDKSDSFSITTEQSIPESPTEFKVADITGRLKVTWNAPRCLRGEVRGFYWEVRYLGPNYAVREDCGPLEGYFLNSTTTDTTFTVPYSFLASKFEVSVAASTDTGIGLVASTTITTEEGGNVF